MERIIIFGTTQFSYMLHKIIERENLAEVVAYTIHERFITKEILPVNNHTLVCPFEQLLKTFPPEQYKILNSIGYTRMNLLRKEIFNECKKKGYELFSLISQQSTILTKLEGEGNIVLPGAYIGTDVESGDCNVFYTGSILTHDINLRDYTFIAAGCTIGGNVSIGSNCFLGMNSTIKNGINIADFSLVGASAYVNRSTEPYGVYIPERSVKLNKRSVELL